MFIHQEDITLLLQRHGFLEFGINFLLDLLLELQRISDNTTLSKNLDGRILTVLGRIQN